MKRLIVAALILVLSLVFSGIILGAQNSPAAPANDPQQEVVTENNQESNAAPELQNEQQDEQQQEEQQQDEEKTGWLANMMNNAAQTVNNLETNLEKTVNEASQVVNEASQVVNEASQTVNEAASDVTIVDQTAAVQGEIVQDDTVGDVAAESSDEVPAMPGFNAGFLGFLSGLTSKDCPACEDGVCSSCGGDYEYCDVCEEGYCTECGGDGKL